MNRFFFAFVCSLCLLNCGDDRLSHENLQVSTASSKWEFPKAHAVSEAGRDQISRASHLEQLFEPSAFIRLEAGETSTFGEATDLTFLENSWYVLDQYTSKVYQFSRDGGFLNAFGGKGQGPGQFQYPKLIERCYDGLLGVADAARGDIQLFDVSGRVASRNRLMADGFTFPVRHAFSWLQKDQLVLVRFPSQNADAPLVVILDPSQAKQTVTAAFGKRLPIVERAADKGVPRKAYTAFACIEGRFWLGSPYQTHVEVYDARGQLIKRLGEGIQRDPKIFLNRDDMAELDQVSDPYRKMRQEILPKHANLLIRQVGKLVVVQMGWTFDVYDLNGNLLGASLKSDFIYMNHTDQNTLVRAIDPVDWQQYVTDPATRALIEASGFNEDDNPGLLLLRLKEPFRKPSTDEFTF